MRKSGLDFRGPKAGKETRGQKVLEQQVQVYSWEETREFRMTWALESDEEVGVGRKELCRIQARGQRQSKNPREREYMGFQKAGSNEGELREYAPKVGARNRVHGPLRNLKAQGLNCDGVRDGAEAG